MADKTFVFKRFDIETNPHDSCLQYDEVESSDGPYVRAQDAIDREAVLQAKIRVLEIQLKETNQSVEKLCARVDANNRALLKVRETANDAIKSDF
jgi:hypothetical protein